MFLLYICLKSLNTMLKRTFTTLLILTSYNNIKAQTPVKDSETYNYAIMTYSNYYGNMRVDLLYGNNINIDLDERLMLDTIRGLPRNKFRKSLLLCVNYMDRIGYELVTSSFSQGLDVCMFRKKRTN